MRVAKDLISALILYLLILWCLYGKSIKWGLALAIGTALLGLPPALIAKFPELLEGRIKSGPALGVLGVYALTQAVVVWAAIKTYYTMDREPGDKRTLALGIAAALLVWIGGLLWSDGVQGFRGLGRRISDVQLGRP